MVPLEPSQSKSTIISVRRVSSGFPIATLTVGLEMKLYLPLIWKLSTMISFATPLTECAVTPFSRIFFNVSWHICVCQKKNKPLNHYLFSKECYTYLLHITQHNVLEYSGPRIMIHPAPWMWKDWKQGGALNICYYCHLFFNNRRKKSLLYCSVGYLKDKGNSKNSSSGAAIPMVLQSFSVILHITNVLSLGIFMHNWVS